MVDFSRHATKKAVMDATIGHPITLGSVAVGFLGGVGLVLFGGPLATGAVIGGIGVGLGSFLVNYFMRGSAFENNHIRKLKQDLERQNAKMLTDLQENLSKIKSFENGGEYGPQSEAQFTKIQNKFEVLKSVLDRKLVRGEITYNRFLGTAEQVHFSVLDNLTQIETILNGLKAIETSDVKQRMKQIKKSTAPDDVAEMKTLENRLQLCDTQLAKVNTMLTQNEEAMTELDKTTTVISNVQMSRGRSSSDLDTALKDLVGLADRAHRYETLR